MQHQGEVAIMRRAARKLLASATMPLAQSPAPIVALFGGEKPTDCNHLQAVLLS